MNRVAGGVWQRIRDVLDDWFAEYPPEHAADLRGRFRRKEPGAHLGAWWELYLHRLFTRLGYTVEVHPSVPGTTKRPDFKLIRGNERVYLEAAVVFSGIVDERRDGAREGWIMDAIDRGTSRNFHVALTFEQLGTRRPRDRDVYRPIEEWLDRLDPDQVTPDYERTFEVDDWRFRLEAVPVRADARDDPPGRLLGYAPVIAGFVDDKNQLRDTLKHKRGRYDTGGVPLVVAVNCATSFPRDEDIASALYGSLAVQYEMGVLGSTKPVRSRDGTWMSDHGPTGQRMAAVLSAVQLHPHTAARTAPRLWHNPWAHAPLVADWPFGRGRCSDQGVVEFEHHEVDMADILGLPAEWPGPKD